MAPDRFGPWADGLTDAERLARIRGLRALVQIFAGARHPLVIALARAETDVTDEALLLAWELLMSAPSRTRRHILASFGQLMKTTPSSPERKASHG
jgi:hypothetical protein